MKWDETIASRCRYGDVASIIFGDAEIIWEHSEDDYQGSANILALMPDGTFAHYEWTYGSCSGCDDWEARGLNDDNIATEMINATAFFKDRTTLKRYLKLENEFKDAPVPTANPPTTGSIPGMSRWLFGSISREFWDMGEALLEWDKTH